MNRKNIIILSMIIALYWFSQYMYMPFLTPYLLRLGLTASVAGVVTGAYGLTQFCFRFPIGFFADRFRQYLWIMRVGILLSFCSSIGFYMVQKPALLFAANFAQGLSSSTWLSFVILYSHLFEEKDYQRAMGLSNALNQGGIVGSYFVGGIMIDKVGISNLFLISASLAASVFVLTFFLKMNQENRQTTFCKEKSINWTEVFGKNTVFYSFIGLVVMFTAFATAFSFTSTMAERLGAAGTELAAVSIAFTLSAALGSYLASKRFIQNMHAGTIICMGMIVIAGCCAVISYAETLIMIVMAQLFEGVSVYLLFSYAMGNATKRIEAGSKSTAMGVFQTIYSMGIFLGPVFMGKVSEEYTLRTAFKVVGVIPLLGMLSILLFYKKRKGKTKV